MKKLLTVIALASAIATPALAAAKHHQTTQSTRQLYMYAPEITGDARAAAMRECNVQAQKWSMSSWETTQFATYGTCMAEHGEQP